MPAARVMSTPSATTRKLLARAAALLPSAKVTALLGSFMLATSGSRTVSTMWMMDCRQAQAFFLRYRTLSMAPT